MTIDYLIEIAEKNKGYEQMSSEQYQCLIALIEDETITSIDVLSKYMSLEII